MTFKPPDCQRCHNAGYYKEAVYQPSRFEMIHLTESKPIRFDDVYETREVACTCWHGQQYQIYKNQSAHPEYENPLADMSDTERDAAIRSEFEL
jgi:hypothetical protein